MRGGAREPCARRTPPTSSERPRAPTKQLGPFPQPAKLRDRSWRARSRPVRASASSTRQAPRVASSQYVWQRNVPQNFAVSVVRATFTGFGRYGREALDQILGDDAAHPDRQPQRDRRERDGRARTAAGDRRTGRRGASRGSRRRDRRRRRSATRRTLLPTWRPSWARLNAVGAARHVRARNAHVVEHALVPARVLPNHLVRRLRQVDQLQQSAARRSGCRARRARSRAWSPRSPPTSESRRAPAACRAARTGCGRGRSASGGSTSSNSGRTSRASRGGARARSRANQRQPPRLVDQPGDRHADEDRRLLDRAHAAAHGRAARSWRATASRPGRRGRPPAGQHVGREPAVGVAVGHRVGVADADVHARPGRGRRRARARSVSGRSAQLSWWALRPSAAGATTSASIFCCQGGSVVAEAPHELGRGRRPSADAAPAPPPRGWPR